MRARAAPASSRAGGAATARPAAACTATSTSCRRAGGLAGRTRSAVRSRDGYVWGRGAVDMKDFDAMLLCVVRARARAGAARRATLVLCFTADEEAGGHHGAQVLVDEHPEELADCTEAVGEVGGFSTTVRGRRLYLDPGGREGHGLDAPHRPRARRPRVDDQRRQRRHPAGRGGGPDRRPPSGRSGSRRRWRSCSARRRARPASRRPPRTPRRWSSEFGDAARMLGAVIRNTANPTMLGAGYKVNVDPDRGDRPRRRPLPARLRGRVLRHPGRAVRRRRRDRLRLEPAPWETPYDGDLVDAMTAACSPRTPTPWSRRT